MKIENFIIDVNPEDLISKNSVNKFKIDTWYDSVKKKLLYVLTQKVNNRYRPIFIDNSGIGSYIRSEVQNLLNKLK